MTLPADFLHVEGDYGASKCKYFSDRDFTTFLPCACLNQESLSKVITLFSTKSKGVGNSTLILI